VEIGTLVSIGPDMGCVMAVLDAGLAAGQEGVDDNEIAKCEVTNWRESVDTVLRAGQRRGGAVACVGLALTADNRKVHEGTLITRGKLDTTEFQVEAKHIW
jgi:hypothetical protein